MRGNFMIEMKNISKKVKGNKVLDDVNYTFEPGRIYGLFGSNGSGKTMLLRTIAGLIHPTEGKIEIDGKVLHKDISFPDNLGIIIEHMQLLPQYDALTNLKIIARIKKKASEIDMKDAISAVGLNPNSPLKVKKYSLGMKQRLNIAQAIFEKPNILLLDEPTNAIDEDGVLLIQELLLKERERGATIIIASHNKDDIAHLCDYQLRMKNGMLLQ